ncbi:MAG: energy coupling factor transporter S component ThiW [Lachnospiraceae bacterium]|jgi:energy coupling factor transporter S component ThiW|nr:energy coupling factor transporter S component ThiW [Lachnospiraceae bacterium]MDD7664630.1 energy coupling factor transporter S component ThiW [Lachnospiraceae bacterium]MDY4165621.1 energy coupling factor transporter S component ThiW [Lachnospiraceae bacterium]
MKTSSIKKLVTSAMFVAIIIALSGFYIPVGASKCFPVQHLVNVLSAVLLGPGWGVAIAFCASLIRNLMGTGTLLAFPGSMVGALCCGLAYYFFKNLPITYVSEVVGTGILGGLIAWPFAKYLMGADAAVFAYVIPFLVSTTGGTIIAAILIAILSKTKALSYLRELLD